MSYCIHQRHLRFLTLGLTVALITMFCASTAQAFCIYNKSNYEIIVKQTKGQATWRGVSWAIEPGKHKCCNWRTKNCNKKQEKTAKVGFDIYYPFIHNLSEQHFCNKTIKAGGWIKVYGKYPEGSCKGFY